jgi:hypothetical protein
MRVEKEEGEEIGAVEKTSQGRNHVQRLNANIFESVVDSFEFEGVGSHKAGWCAPACQVEEHRERRR